LLFASYKPDVYMYNILTDSFTQQTRQQFVYQDKRPLQKSCFFFFIFVHVMLKYAK